MKRGRARSLSHGDEVRPLLQDGATLLQLRRPLIGRANLASRQARREDWSRRRNPPLDLKRWRVTASPPPRPTSWRRSTSPTGVCIMFEGEPPYTGNPFFFANSFNATR